MLTPPKLERVPTWGECQPSRKKGFLRHVSSPCFTGYGTRRLVRLGVLVKKNQKRNRAEAVEGPSPGGVWGGNGRALTGSRGPYLLGRMNLKSGTNRPVQSQAVNWATAGLLVDPRRCWPAFPAARRRQQSQAT